MHFISINMSIYYNQCKWVREKYLVGKIKKNISIWFFQWSNTFVIYFWQGHLLFDSQKFKMSLKQWLEFHQGHTHTHTKTWKMMKSLECLQAKCIYTRNFHVFTNLLNLIHGSLIFILENVSVKIVKKVINVNRSH